GLASDHSWLFDGGRPGPPSAAAQAPALSPADLAVLPWAEVGGFAAGALASARLSRELLGKAKLSRGGFAAGMGLSLLAGGALGAAALAALSGLSPVVAAATLAFSAASGAYLFRGKLLPANIRLSGSRPETLFALEGEGVKAKLTLREEQLGRPLLLSATFDQGVGHGTMLSALLAGHQRVYFRRAGEQLQLMGRNSALRASPGSPAERAVGRAVGDTIIASVPILGEEQGAKKVTVSLAALFGQDLLDIRSQLKSDVDAATPYQLNEKAGQLSWAKAFPRNVEISSELVFSSPEGVSSGYRPDSRNLTIGLRYSLSAPPEDAFEPREADDRLGHFTTVFEDFTDATKSEVTVRLVNRWKLEKAEPAATLSAPKEPIVWWIENTVPHEYREAVRRGILAWNKAFERIGFKDAIVVKQQPDPEPARAAVSAVLGRLVAGFFGFGAEGAAEAKEAEEAFDPSDARFNVFRWTQGIDYGGAIGPSRADPVNGRIYNAGVVFAAGMVQMEPTVEWLQGTRPAGAHAGCEHAEHAAKEAAFARAVLEARGSLTDAQKRKLVEDFVTDVTIHEMGHTLGLRHNFAASTYRTLAELETAQDGVLAASAMDYLPYNISLAGRPQGSLSQTELGPYDYWAIEYAYAPLEGLDAAQKREALAKIAARAGEKGLSYATDEDVTGMDPYAQRWDLGADPLAFARQKVQLVGEFWSRLRAKELSPGEPYQRLRRTFMGGMAYYRQATDIAAAFVGGIRFHRLHAGDPKAPAPYEPVAAEKQREALAFLRDAVFADAPFAFPPEFLSKLAPERQATIGRPYPDLQHLPFAESVLWLRQRALGAILDPDVLRRIAESRHLANDAFTIAELLRSLEASIWSELGAKPRIALSPLRRDLQSAHVDALLELAKDQDLVPEAKAELRASLVRSFKRLVQARRRKLADADRAHFAAVQDRIRAGLSDD
ncbi:MAG: zinc-dependent metalloprotease, partial [Elusimicrobia bacterium]|nr:zinc-dependent metalloprotease [Elusimicrobiota bacterium]